MQKKRIAKKCLFTSCFRTVLINTSDEQRYSSKFLYGKD